VLTTAAAGFAVVAIAAPGVALATVPSPPSIASAFAPASVGISGTTTLAFTITNPNPSGSLTGIGFTDTLPTGVVVDTPNGESGTCGTNGVVNATAGTGAISLSGGTLKGGANCVVSVNVTSSTPGVYSETSGAVSSNEGGAGNTATSSLTVIGNPTISVGSPRNGATFDFGQKVNARYACAEAANGPGIVDCSATDASGNTIASGSPLTTTAGPNTLTVSATSADGLLVTATINYTVRPDNEFVISHVKAHKNGQLSFYVVAPGAGKLTALESAVARHTARFEFASWSDAVRGARTLHVTVKPGKRGGSLISAHPGKITLRLTVAFTPKGGLKRTTTVAGIAIPA
jgi:hypothetical protein